MSSIKLFAFAIMLLTSLLLVIPLRSGNNGLTALLLVGFAFANLLILKEKKK